MRRFGPLVFVLFFVACGPSTLDRHILSANEFRLASDQAVPAFRAACPTAGASDRCRELTEAQHAFVAAHIEWVRALVREARADHWRYPGDTAELRAFCASYARLSTAAAATSVPLLPVAAGTMHVCEDAR